MTNICAIKQDHNNIPISRHFPNALSWNGHLCFHNIWCQASPISLWMQYFHRLVMCHQGCILLKALHIIKWWRIRSCFVLVMLFIWVHWVRYMIYRTCTSVGMLTCILRYLFYYSNNRIHHQQPWLLLLCSKALRQNHRLLRIWMYLHPSIMPLIRVNKMVVATTTAAATTLWDPPTMHFNTQFEMMPNWVVSTITLLHLYATVTSG